MIIFSAFSQTLIEKGNEAYHQKNIKKAIKFYKQALINGNDEAGFILGKIFYNGRYVVKDLNRAMKYFRMVAQYGHKKAKYNIGVIYGLQTYKHHSYEKSYQTMLELAKEGYPKAQNRVGLHLTGGIGAEKDYKMAVKWFENAYFEHDFKEAGCHLAFMFANGYGVFPNFGRASVLARIGMKNNIPYCKKVFNEYKLEKYTEDKSFKFGHYRSLEY